jgi:hypothetical protein
MTEVGFCASMDVNRLKGQALCLSLADCRGEGPALSGLPCFPADHSGGFFPGAGFPAGTGAVFYMLPDILSGVPFADKIAAGAAFEAARPGPWLWVDEETVFLKKPVLPDESLLAANPVDLRNIGEAPGTQPDEFWRILLDRFGLEDGLPGLRSTVSGEPVRGYYNAGMILVRENRHAFRAALDAMTELMGSPAFRRVLAASPLRPVFFHQAVLSCALEALYPGRIVRLPEGWNLPYHLRTSWPGSLKSADPVSLRYDDCFDGMLPEAVDGRTFLSRVRAACDRDAQTRKEGL